MSLREVPALLWVALLLGVLPVLAVVNGIALRSKRSRSAGAARMRSLTRPQLYRATMLGLAQLLAVTLLLDGIDRFRVVRSALVFPPSGWLWILGCVAAHQGMAISTMVVRRARGLTMDPGIGRLLPRTGAERLGFIPVALAAGIAEEMVYRGFALGHLLAWGVPVGVAVAVTTIGFGLMHGYKSVVGMARSAFAGLVITLPVLATGSLVPSIVTHVVVDLIAGNATLPLARRLGVPIAEPAAPGPALPVAASAQES